MKKLICILFLIFLVTIPSVSADENNTKTEEREEILVIEVPQDNQIDNETNLPEETPDSQKNEKILNVADKQLPEEEKEEENLDENNNAYSYNEFENSETIEDSSDTVYLNSTPTKKFNLKKRTIITNQKPVIHQDEDFRVSPQNVDLYRNNDIYSKKTTSFSNEKKFGNLTFGSKHDNTFTMNEYSGTRTLFSKYDINRFSFSTSYKNNSLSSFDQQFRGTFSFSPEYRLNEHLSLQSIYSRNFMDRSNKNEIVFTLKPFKDDRMNFNIGAGQIYYEDAAPTRSQLNFATKINF